MNQNQLYKLIQKYGFTVLVFEDHPQFFGNWLVKLKGGQEYYEVISDNREGWLTFIQGVNDSRKKIDEVESYKFSQNEVLHQIEEWLKKEKG